LYTPSAFAEHGIVRIHEFMRDHSFATVVTNAGTSLIASHLPLLLDADVGPSGVLLGHMARANPQWRFFEGECMTIFHGPHAYISPSLYGEHGTVPTWNYIAVHAYGCLRIVEDREGLLDILRRSVAAYENPRSVPWNFDESGPHVEKLLRAIVGIRIEITRLEGKWKLSQNHTEERRRKVIDGLNASAVGDARAVASMMNEVLQSALDGPT